jgi:hypothetical protein
VKGALAWQVCILRGGIAAHILLGLDAAGLAGGCKLEELQSSGLSCTMQVLPYVKTLHAGPGMSGGGSPKLQPAA